MTTLADLFARGSKYYGVFDRFLTRGKVESAPTPEPEFDPTASAEVQYAQSRAYERWCWVQDLREGTFQRSEMEFPYTTLPHPDLGTAKDWRMTAIGLGLLCCSDSSDLARRSDGRLIWMGYDESRDLWPSDAQLSRLNLGWDGFRQLRDLQDEGRSWAEIADWLEAYWDAREATLVAWSKV